MQKPELFQNLTESERRILRDIAYSQRQAAIIAQRSAEDLLIALGIIPHYSFETNRERKNRLTNCAKIDTTEQPDTD